MKLPVPPAPLSPNAAPAAEAAPVLPVDAAAERELPAAFVVADDEQPARARPAPAIASVPTRIKLRRLTSAPVSSCNSMSLSLLEFDCGAYWLSACIAIGHRPAVPEI